MTTTPGSKPTFRAYGRDDIDSIPQLGSLLPGSIVGMKAVSAVLPFRVNSYVLENLIRWEDVPDDPIYQLTFPQPGMLAPDDLRTMLDLVENRASEAQIKTAARRIQLGLNPHPAGQMELNVPRLHGKPIPGLQHKYRETVLFFPSQGQTCHAYCTYCFRWAQFVGIDELKFASREVDTLVGYLKEHPEVRGVLFTGGDPLIMKTAVLRRYIEPLLAPGLEHIQSIRIGTKAPAYWPHRFLTDSDADDLMRLFQQVVKSGRHLALMAHFSHPIEMQPEVATKALRRIIATGATVRCQAPIVRHVNDRPQIWADLWQEQIRVGAVPYYMFVERDTGPKGYFEVPLAEAHEIFTTAFRRVCGLARTVRGPSMSSTFGKVVVDGVGVVGAHKAFILKFIQARDPAWVNRPFFARFDPAATWMDQLIPLEGDEFFFTREIAEMKRIGREPAWRQPLEKVGPATLFGHVEWE